MDWLSWFKNPGASAKAIWTFITLVQPFLKMTGVEMPGFLDEAWLSATLLFIAPIGAWWITNRMTAKQVAVAVVKQPELEAELKKEGIVVAAAVAVKPVPVPGGDTKPHSSAMKPVPRKGSAK